MLIKYSIQSGVINVNEWRKKVDEEFGEDTSFKVLCLIECLRTETRKQSNIFIKHFPSPLVKNFKEVLIQIGFDLVKPHIEIINRYLNEQKSKIERELTFKNSQELTQ